MHPRTAENLKTAMEAEAYSSAKCFRFAAHARMHDNHELASLFQETADVDRYWHFQEEFNTACLLGEYVDHLSAAIDEKLRQIEMYSRFHAAALADCDNAAAALFSNFHKDELNQLDAFQESMTTLKTTGGTSA